MGSRIRVLIADDQAISREGIHRLLEREDDMTIVGVVQTAPEVLPQVSAKNPDVVLLDLKWHRDDQAMDKVIAQLRRVYPKICIIGLTVYNNLVQGARDAGAEWVVTKDMEKDKLLRLIRAAYASTAKVVGPGEFKKARSALMHLRSLETGKRYAAAYERDVCLILETVLHPHLTNPRTQARNISGSRRRDILFSNYSSHLFWQRMSHSHKATQIVFEVKNVKRVDGCYIDQIAGYLKPRSRGLGFLVSRTLPGKPILQRAVEEFQAEGKVILFLCDDDLEQMLNLREKEDDPTELIKQRYDDFIALT